MRTFIEINIYGKNTLLATFRKQNNIPTGIYFDRPVKSLINLTPNVKINAKLKIEKVFLGNDDISLLVSNEKLQASDLIQTLGLNNFESLIKDAENNGWIVEKYIDGINRYFHLGHTSKPLSKTSFFSEKALKFFLFILMASTPALVLVIMNSGYLRSPFWIFTLFLGLTLVVYFLSFGIMQYMKSRGESIF